MVKYTHRTMRRTKLCSSLIYYKVNGYVVPTHTETVRTDMTTKCNLYSYRLRSIIINMWSEPKQPRGGFFKPIHPITGGLGRRKQGNRPRREQAIPLGPDFERANM